MNLSPGSQILQLAAWVFALVEMILSFYILILNVRHSANRHTSLLVFLLAMNNVAMGILIGADARNRSSNAAFGRDCVLDDARSDSALWSAEPGGCGCWRWVRWVGRAIVLPTLDGTELCLGHGWLRASMPALMPAVICPLRHTYPQCCIWSSSLMWSLGYSLSHDRRVGDREASPVTRRRRNCLGTTLIKPRCMLSFSPCDPC